MHHSFEATTMRRRTPTATSTRTARPASTSPTLQVRCFLKPNVTSTRFVVLPQEMYCTVLMLHCASFSGCELSKCYILMSCSFQL